MNPEYILLTLGTNHYVVTAGVADAVRRITRPISQPNIHLSSTITSISHDPRAPSTVRIAFDGPEGQSSVEGFNHVLIATQANQAVPLLSTLRSSYPAKSSIQRATDAQIACLRRFKYVPTIVVNHRDESFLPANAKDIRDLNLVCASPTSALSAATPALSQYKSDIPSLPAGYAMATHVIKPRRISSSKNDRALPTILQTTNPLHPPHPNSILSVARIERAVVTVDSKEAQRELITVGSGRWKFVWKGFAKASWIPFTFEHTRPRRLGSLQGPGRLSPLITADGDSLPPGVWLCGSYAHPGIPLLEACVTSALAVVENGIFAVEGVNHKARWAIH